MERYVEIINFRLFRMPCCGQMLCWVNPRLPTHCPECGKSVLTELRSNPDCTMMHDTEAQLKSGFQQRTPPTDKKQAALKIIEAREGHWSKAAVLDLITTVFGD